jgi:hypothetical protein
VPTRAGADFPPEEPSERADDDDKGKDPPPHPYNSSGLVETPLAWHICQADTAPKRRCR